MKTICRCFAVIAAATLCCGSLNSVAAVREYAARVVREYPHDASAYTQGLFFWNGQLYESTGQYGESSIRIVDLSSGRVRRKVELGRRYFGEGSCVVDGILYLLTWTNRLAYKYDAASLKWLKTVSYPREGWGLCAVGPDRSSASGETGTSAPAGESAAVATASAASAALGDGKAVMIASDGSSNLYWLDRDLRTVRTVKVTFNGRPLSYLNELEWIDGKVWANVYTTDMIVIINPVSGVVEGRVDCSSIMPLSRRTPSMDVLNGIALAPDGNIYLTGKNWPALFSVRLELLNGHAR